MWYTIFSNKNHVTNNEEAFTYEDSIALTRVCLVDYVLPTSLERCFRKANTLLTLDLNTKLINFQRAYV